MWREIAEEENARGMESILFDGMPVAYTTVTNVTRRAVGTKAVRAFDVAAMNAFNGCPDDGCRVMRDDWIIFGGLEIWAGKREITMSTLG
ncbi:hypothetical protein EGT07_21825 [Herbaspirillum sp. HC18]|nr:hypothetical protein EGT07_21825 [Herbaspirillum sp. HC18]